MENLTVSEKIDICICVGTTCYVLGASDLLTLEDYLEPTLKNQITLRGSTCLDLCRQGKGEPPFVLVDGECHSKVTMQKLIGLVKERHSQKEAARAGDGK